MPANPWTDEPRLLRLIDELEQQSRRPFDPEDIIEKIQGKVIGQNAVVEQVVRAILGKLMQKRQPQPPTKGVFCFAGPPGVGKTYLAKILAEHVFNRPNSLLHFDMSQFGDAYAATTLFGVAQGYAGGEGKLTSQLRDMPQSLVLLDEIEKAHDDVRKRFLTAWNDGFLTDARTGKQISTREAVFVVTTNARMDELCDMAARLAGDADAISNASVNLLREGGFAPEVLDRLDAIFVFQRLSDLDFSRILSLELVGHARSYGVEVEPGGITPELLLAGIKRYRALDRSVRRSTKAMCQMVEAAVQDACDQNAAIIRLGMDATESATATIVITKEKIS